MRYKAGIALVVLLAAHSLHAQNVYYRFTGTVEGTDPVIGFSSPESVSIGLDAEIGDQVSGTFGVGPMGRGISLNPSSSLRIFIENVFDFRVTMGDQELLPESAPAGDSLLLNDNAERVGWLELDPLSSGVADVLTITTPQGGIGVEPWPSLGITLNFTDSSRTVHQDFTGLSAFPQQIDFERFDVTKGFIRSWLTDSQSSDQGIMFNIDSLEEFDPSVEPSVDPPVEPTVPMLSTGYHIAWRADSTGLILESADSAEGPWTKRRAVPLAVGGQNIIGIDAINQLELFRLAPDPRRASHLYYEFTGTVEGTDSVIGFNSPSSPAPGLEAEIGDQLSGTFRVSYDGNFKNPESGDRTVFVDSILDLHVKLNQTELTPSDVSRGHFGVSNDIIATGQDDHWNETLLGSDVGDLFSIDTSRLATGGGGAPSRLSFILNFTDSSATAVDPAGGPRMPIDFARFDVTKGFIVYEESPSGRTTQGIQFNIDSLEKFDPNARLDGPVEVSMGFHATWLADAETYILEVADNEDGPWVPSERSLENVNGLNMVLMDSNDRSKHFRLVKIER